jgi:Cu/Ag efflux pump CusA
MIEQEKADSIISSVIHFSLSRRILIIFLVIMAVGGGIFSFIQLPRDIFPDITLPVFNVVTQNNSMSQEEVELLITRPIETSMNGLPGIKL